MGRRGDDAGLLRILTWNLFHGRSRPGAGRGLLGPFGELLAGAPWDVALLQEVPPWWAEPLAARCAAEQRRVLTSRNLGLRLRRVLAERRPDLMRANGGGSNVILSRRPVVSAGAIRLRLRPERRVAQLVRLAEGTTVVNFHASRTPAQAEHELERLWRWAGERADPRLVLGGDLNLRSPVAPRGVLHVAAHAVDHVFATGLEPAGAGRLLGRRVDLGGLELELSDHAPLLVEVRHRAPSGS